VSAARGGVVGSFVAQSSSGSGALIGGIVAVVA